MPVIDEVANDYLDDVEFLAIAWRSDLNRAQERADELFSDNLKWGIDENVFELYGVRGQPTSVIVAQGIVVDAWFGAVGEAELRRRLDAVVSLSS